MRQAVDAFANLNERAVSSHVPNAAGNDFADLEFLAQ